MNFSKCHLDTKDAISTFQQAMSQLLKPLINKEALVFVDDVTICAKTIPEFDGMPQKSLNYYVVTI
jgi:hypothetical protein